MIYECLKPTTTLSPGETYSTDDLLAMGCDIAHLERAEAIKPVGFLSAGAPLSDSEAARTIADLQAQFQKAEDERDVARDELREAVRKVRALEASHREGAAQLAAAYAEAKNLRAELASLRAAELPPTQPVILPVV